MPEQAKSSFLKKVYGNSALALKTARDGKIDDLLRVYHDLEKTLRSLKANYDQNAGNLNYINMKKLIAQLSRTKRKLERKIGNTVLLEKQNFKKKIKAIASNLSHKNPH